MVVGREGCVGGTECGGAVRSECVGCTSGSEGVGCRRKGVRVRGSEVGWDRTGVGMRGGWHGGEEECKERWRECGRTGVRMDGYVSHNTSASSAYNMYTCNVVTSYEAVRSHMREPQQGRSGE